MYSNVLALSFCEVYESCVSEFSMFLFKRLISTVILGKLFTWWTGQQFLSNWIQHSPWSVNWKFQNISAASKPFSEHLYLHRWRSSQTLTDSLQSHIDSHCLESAKYLWISSQMKSLIILTFWLESFKNYENC